MSRKRSDLGGRRRVLRYLALGPLAASCRSLALPQAVKSTSSTGVHVRPTIQQLSEQIRKRLVSPLELTRNCLARIEKLNPKLNAFITVMSESAMAEAKTAEGEIQKGNYRGPLHGIPIGLKDIIDTAGTRTTAASLHWKDRVPAADAEVVCRLRAAGAVILGKQNLHEFAYGGSSIVSAFGEMRNPWDLSRIPGGSSGGSAASVATGLGCAAIGTDTGGSVREPAAFCGIVGLKPTYGRVSARGVAPLSWSLDHVGPIVNSVCDSALMLQVMAGYDAGDPGSANVPGGDYVAKLADFRPGLRIGIPRAFFFHELHPDIASAVEAAIGVFRELRAEIRDVTLSVPTDRVLFLGEAYAVHEPLLAKSPELYQPGTLSRLRSAADISASAALRARRELDADRQAIRRVFDEVDMLLTPTVPVLPPKIAELQEHPEDLRAREIVLLRNTRPFNVWGIPAISIPCGFTKEGLPIGLQLAAAHWREDLVLQAAFAYEQATAWHERAAPMSSKS